MKLNYLFLTATMLLTSCQLFDCEIFGGGSNSETPSNSESGSQSQQDPGVNIYDEDYNLCNDLSNVSNDGASYFDFDYFTTTVTDETVKYGQQFVNNKEVDLGTTVKTSDDAKFVFYTDNEARFVNLPDGYALSVPTNKTLVTDFSISKYRSKLYNDELTLTVTYEHSNPYPWGGTNEKGSLTGWKTYRDEWLLEYLEKEKWYTANGLKQTRRLFEKTTIKSTYTITEYSIEIENPGNISKPFYNIAVIRESFDYKHFFLLVMKSTHKNDDAFDHIVESFTEVAQYGEANNDTMNDMPVVVNPNWNEETKNYYNKLLTQQRTDWAWYNGNMPTSSEDGNNANSSETSKNFLGTYDIYKESQTKYEDAYDYTFDVVSSYAHISWGNSFTSGRFPASAAALHCGNGFDGKPVIQFNYQFTDNNNNLSATGSNEKSPMFDILRGRNEGELDFFSYRNNSYNALCKLADNLKKYGKPVLFRLNNEMNTDWTSYCGLINMLDPDLFQASWRLVYRIFEERGVQNAIFIFNPIADSCPYSSWGEDLCYFPGNKYVHVLGLTSYQFNNSNQAATSAGSFEGLYKELYNKNNAVWNNFPWSISEFACGSGGEDSGLLYRYAQSQAQWVSDMFDELDERPDYVKNIKIAVWFSANDYNDTKITNALNIPLSETKMAATIAAFKAGLAKTNKKAE